MRRGGFSGGYNRFQSSRGSGGGAAIPPPPSIQANATVVRKNNKGFATMNAIHEMASSIPGTYAEVNKKRNRTQEEYFDEEDEPAPYIPAPGSPGFEDAAGKKEDSDEDDPLDAFMADIEKEVKYQTEKPPVVVTSKSKGIRDDIEAEDDEETYYRFLKKIYYLISHV